MYVGILFKIFTPSLILRAGDRERETEKDRDRESGRETVRERER